MHCLCFCVTTLDKRAVALHSSFAASADSCFSSGSSLATRLTRARGRRSAKGSDGASRLREQEVGVSVVNGQPQSEHGTPRALVRLRLPRRRPLLHPQRGRAGEEEEGRQSAVGAQRPPM